MGIDDLLNKKSSEFVSIYDVVAELSKTESITIQKAASALYVMCEEDENWMFSYRDNTNLAIIHTYPDSEYSLPGRFFGLDCLKKITQSDILETSLEEDTLYNTGWCKYEIIKLFNSNKVKNLPCFDQDHVSSPNHNQEFDYLPTLEKDKSILVPNWDIFSKYDNLTKTELACLLNSVCPKYYENWLKESIQPDFNYDEYDRQIIIEKYYQIPNNKAQDIESTINVIERQDPKNLRMEYNGVYHYFDFSSAMYWAESRGYSIDRRLFVSFGNEEPASTDLDTTSGKLDVLDMDHPCHSKKLKVTIEVWEYVTSKWGTSTTTPRQLAYEWLEANEGNFSFQLSKKLKDSICSIINFREGSQITTEEKAEAKRAMDLYNSQPSKADATQGEEFPF
jgi:hypothetical protein